MFRKPTDNHEFKPLLVEIEERPLNPLGRTIFWIIIAAIVFLGLWAFLGKVDIVVSARGKVIPVGEVKSLQPLNAGVVHSILVSTGDHVLKGQILMEIDPSEIDPELESMKAGLKQAELEIIRLEALLAQKEFNPGSKDIDTSLFEIQNKIYLSEKMKLLKQVFIMKESLAQLDEKLASEKRVVGKSEYLLNVCAEKLQRLQQVRDIISRDEYDQAEKECKENESQLDSSRHRVEELKANISQVQGELELSSSIERNRLLSELADVKTKFLNLYAKIKRADFVSRRQQIKSPVNGYVSQLFVHTIGGVVTPAEKLGLIVPDESKLVVKALIQNKDVGFIAQEMPVSIKVDAFSFQKYGILDGKVLQVAKDSMEDQNSGLVYEVYIEPLEPYLIVDGVETPISTGMSVTAEIKVGKRRIIEFFIYPLIRYLDEGISVR